MEKIAPPMPDSRYQVVAEAIRTFPASVPPVAYALAEPPVCVPLAALLSLEQLVGLAPTEDAVLAKFARRLREARPDLSEAELLELPVPASAGDQEVFLARLGKWRFELKQLERAMERP